MTTTVVNTQPASFRLAECLAPVVSLRAPAKARVFTLEFRGICAAGDAEFERIMDRFASLFVQKVGK